MTKFNSFLGDRTKTAKLLLPFLDAASAAIQLIEKDATYYYAGVASKTIAPVTTSGATYLLSEEGTYTNYRDSNGDAIIAPLDYYKYLLVRVGSAYSLEQLSSLINIINNLGNLVAYADGKEYTYTVGTPASARRVGVEIPKNYKTLLRLRFTATAEIEGRVYWQIDSDGLNLIPVTRPDWTDDGNGGYYFDMFADASTTDGASNLFFMNTTNTVTVESTVSIVDVSTYSSINEKLDDIIPTDHRDYNLMTPITVKKDGTGDFETIQEAVNSIIDADITNQYDIQVYDDFEVTDPLELWYASNPLVQNGMAADITQYMAYVINKNWVHVRGMNRIIKIKVVMPTTLTATSYQYVDVLRPQGNCTLGNIRLELTGGRYCRHQESGGDIYKDDYKALTIYNNIEGEHFGNSTALGYPAGAWPDCYDQANGGVDGLRTIYNHCKWKSPVGPFYTHENVDFSLPMHYEFNQCEMQLSGNEDSRAGTNTRYDDDCGIVSQGSGQVSTIKMVGCNFFSFYVKNTEWYGQSLDSKCRDWRNGGAVLQASANAPMKLYGYTTKTLSVRRDSTGAGKTIEVVDDTETNVNSAYNDLFGNIYKEYASASGVSAITFGTERILDNASGSYTFSMAYRLGDCSVTNKTLTIKVDGIDRVVTFANDYTQLSGGLVYDQTSILAEMNAQLSTYAVCSVGGLRDWVAPSDIYEVGFNASAVGICDGSNLKAVVRDYTQGWKGWRLAQAGEKIEGICIDRMNPYDANSLSFGRIILRAKCTLSTIDPTLAFNNDALGIYYKAGDNGSLVTTITPSEADFVGIGNSTLKWYE